MKTVDRGGYIWISDASREELNTLYLALSFRVPGCEHMPLFKRGTWDGHKRFFEWRTKRFRRGLVDFVRRKTGMTIDVIPDKCFPVPVLCNPDGKMLRDFQGTALEAMLMHPGRDVAGGLAQMATNAGKTAVIAGIARAMVDAGLSLVVFERSEDLLNQVKEEIEVWSGLRLGEWSAKRKDIKPVTVAMVQSVYGSLQRVVRLSESDRDVEIIEHLRTIGAVVIDEAHHVAADSCAKLLDLNPASLRFGLSGTIPAEEDIEGIEIRALCGDVVARVSNKELIDAEISARPTIRVVEYEVDGLEDKAKEYGKTIKNDCFKVKTKDDNGKDAFKPGPFNTAIYTARVREYAMNYAMRHDTRFWDAVKALADRHPKESTAILVDWVEFAEDLARHVGAEIMHGQLPRAERERVLSGFSSGKITRVVSTSVIDEGLSIDRIKVLILANAGSSTRQFLQRIGRGLRHKVEDNTLTVYCFAMYGHKYLLEPSKGRLRLWKSEGFEVVFED